MTTTEATFVDRLRNMGACKEAINWVGERDMPTAWAECPRADWMLWFAAHVDGCYSQRVRLAACACARTALRYVPAGEDRPLRAIEMAERYTRGEASEEEKMVAASAAASAAAWAAAGDAAWAAASAAAQQKAHREMADLIRERIPSVEEP